MIKQKLIKQVREQVSVYVTCEFRAGDNKWRENCILRVGGMCLTHLPIQIVKYKYI